MTKVKCGSYYGRRCDCSIMRELFGSILTVLPEIHPVSKPIIVILAWFEIT